MFTLLMSTFSLKLAGNVVFAMSFLRPPRSFSVRMSAGRIMVEQAVVLSTLGAAGGGVAVAAGTQERTPRFSKISKYLSSKVTACQVETNKRTRAVRVAITARNLRNV